MKRRGVVAAVLILLAMPPLVAAIAAANFHLHNRNNGSIVSSGEKRGYILYVPRAYDASKPAPLVISMHGAAGWPAQQRDMSEWNRVADREGFIVVYPSASDYAVPRIWRVSHGAGLTRDVQFISDLIDELQSAYNIDHDRIYANGASNGGGMTFVLSCTMSDRLAAVGMVAAAQTLAWSWCKDRRPIPAIIFHGTADPMIPFAGGPSWMSPGAFPSQPTWATNWSRRNRCGPPVESRIAADVIRREYTNCVDGADVAFYTIAGGGHTWPGGGELPEWFVGRTTRTIDASSVMWRFFWEHPLRRR